MNSGLLLINKSEGPSSFDVIRTLRRNLRIKKMGHAGTLDPLASGLMIIAVGQVTKLLPHLPTDIKEYHFTIQFGETRTTGDREGEVLESGFRTPEEDELLSVLDDFRGEIEQIPPAFSAIKIDGKRAYELAREGKEVEMKSRKVAIHSLELLQFDAEAGTAQMVVSCSAGTYVRSLARDIALSLESGAYASRIHRTKVGPFKLEDALSADEVLNAEQLMDPASLMGVWLPLSLSGKSLELFRNGNPVSVAGDYREGDLLWVKGDDQIPLALARFTGGVVKPIRVFPSW